MEKSVKVSIPASLEPTGFGRKQAWTGHAGNVTGDQSTSQVKALASLAERCVAALKRASAEPTFWTDDQGGFWVAVPSMHGGSRCYRVHSDQSVYAGSWCTDEPAEAFERSVGMTRIY